MKWNQFLNFIVILGEFRVHTIKLTLQKETQSFEKYSNPIPTPTPPPVHFLQDKGALKKTERLDGTTDPSSPLPPPPTPPSTFSLRQEALNNLYLFCVENISGDFKDEFSRSGIFFPSHV